MIDWIVGITGLIVFFYAALTPPRIYNKYWDSNRNISYCALFGRVLLLMAGGFSFIWSWAIDSIRVELIEALPILFLVPSGIALLFILMHKTTISNIRKYQRIDCLEARAMRKRLDMPPGPEEELLKRIGEE